jgi:osmotically-inducible protein OsmY
MKKFILTSTILLSTTACIPVIIGGAGVAGYTGAQERPVGGAVDDAAINTEINSYFLNSKEKGLFKDINIESVDGRVLLTGSVKTREARIEAFRLAWQPKAVKEVINEIKVNEGKNFSAKQASIDAYITTQVKSKLLITKGVRSINYNVETIDNVVYLIGIARSQDEVNIVVDIARTIDQVKSVVNHIKLRDPSLKGNW